MPGVFMWGTSQGAREVVKLRIFNKVIVDGLPLIVLTYLRDLNPLLI